MVNDALARCGPLVSSEMAKYTEVPSDLLAEIKAESLGDYQGSYKKLFRGVALNSGDVIELEDVISSLRGVYDLPILETNETTWSICTRR